MSIGTKSLLFGYHQFLLHPIALAISWWKLFGFPWDLRLWVAFVVHDWGYWGKPNMDGPEGEQHPYLGARIMQSLFDRKFRWPERVTGYNRLTVSPWYNFTILHSRFMAKAKNMHPSRLCAADKYVSLILPWWVQLPLMNLTGEIHEYMKGQNGRTGSNGGSQLAWFRAMQSFLKDWVRVYMNTISTDPAMKIVPHLKMVAASVTGLPKPLPPNANEVVSWAQAVLTALNVGDVKRGSPLHSKLREVMIAYRDATTEKSEES